MRNRSTVAHAPGGANRRRVLVVGGGHTGLNVALRLQQKLPPERIDITVVDPQPHMTYQPFLPEAAAGSVEPRHVAVPLRQALAGCRVLTAEVTGINQSERSVTVHNASGHTEELGYDVLVVVPGSISKALPIPGLAEQGIGFKTIGEAIYLRNHVLSRLDAAASTLDPDLRRRLLTFVFVGGGYAGIEAMAELQDMARYATRYYRTLTPTDMRWVLVEAADRIMPEVSAEMGRYTEDRLAERGIEIHLQTTITTMVDGAVTLDSGEQFYADTVAWTAGVKPHPLLSDTDLPLDEKGRLRCNAKLQVIGTQGVFSAGDCAAVPDLTSSDPNALCGPSAQHAVRQAHTLADNIIAALSGQPLTDYRHRYAGSVASLGLYRGAAEIYGVKLKGFPAWLLHRAYHLSKMPLANRKARILMDWLMAVPFRRQVVSLGEIHDPRAEFQQAAGTRGLPAHQPAAHSSQSASSVASGE